MLLNSILLDGLQAQTYASDGPRRDARARNNRKEILMKRRLEDFKALSPARRVVVSALVAAALALVAAAERDIQRRPADQVRGSKALWRLVCTNALGAVGYFSWGRRRPQK
jgi:hypothetical protein